jgi:hypothetical protein
MQGCSCRPLLAPNPDWTRNTPPAHPFGELRQAGISLLGQKPERLFVGGRPVRENVRWSSCLILPWAISAPASPRPAARFTVSLIHRSSLASQKRAIWQASRNGGIKIRAVGNPGVLQPRAPIPLRLGACRADTGGRARRSVQTRCGSRRRYLHPAWKRTSPSSSPEQAHGKAAAQFAARCFAADATEQARA